MTDEQQSAIALFQLAQESTQPAVHVGAAFAAGRMKIERVFEPQSGEFGVPPGNFFPADAGDLADIEVIQSLIALNGIYRRAYFASDDPSRFRRP